jgi:microcystin-dependent protein
MTYQVKFTESTNSAKPALIVEDKAVNDQTSLVFVGQNSSGYAPIFAENFLHLLENFAKNIPPSNPVEGQLWYDNTTSESLLKVFDGSNWLPTGSVTRNSVAPSSVSSINGDLWVNTNTQQLYIFSGTSWSLIGPQFSTGLKTGTTVDTVSDTLADVNNTADHNIISLYANNERIAILSAETFTPKAYITGFPKVNRGITLTTEQESLVSAKLVGTATAADSLNVNSVAVAASNFLRSDVVSTTVNEFQIKSVSGLTIGGDLSFNIGQPVVNADATGLIALTSTNKNVQFRVKDTLNALSTVMHIDTRLRVGIKNINPQSDLDVTGTVAVSSNVVVGSATALSTVATGGITSYGNLSVYRVATFNGEVKTTSKLIVSSPIGINANLPNPAIVPTISETFDIGSESLKFRTIYATNITASNFTGGLTGDVTGNVSGSAMTLKAAASIELIGDMTSAAVSYNGKDNIQINTTVSSGFITNKPEVTESFDNDTLLIFRNAASSASAEVKRISKTNFLETVPSVPVGAIFPYAGKVDALHPAPKGYLLCDGSELLIATYRALHEVIGTTYRSNLVGNGTFALPDLRGRFPLGADNMDNPSLANVPDIISGDLIDARGNRNGTVGGVAINPLQRANRIQNEQGRTLGGSSGAETFGSAVAETGTNKFETSPLGTLYSDMNPYLTINYIIFTGVL